MGGCRNRPGPTFKARLLRNEEGADTKRRVFRTTIDEAFPTPPFSAPTIFLCGSRPLKVGSGPPHDYGRLESLPALIPSRVTRYSKKKCTVEQRAQKTAI